MKKLLVLLIYLPLILTMCAASTEIDEKSTGSLAIYGNWCGPNHPKDVNDAPEPIDVLDATCKRHDLCYEKDGYLNCQCDAVFREEIRKDLKADSYDRTQRMYAKTAELHFAVSPCDGDGKGKAGPSKALHGLYNGVKIRIMSFVDRFSENNEENGQDSTENSQEKQ